MLPENEHTILRFVGGSTQAMVTASVVIPSGEAKEMEIGEAYDVEIHTTVVREAVV